MPDLVKRHSTPWRNTSASPSGHGKITIMTNPQQGAVAPYQGQAVQGSVVSPTAVVDAKSNRTRNFLNAISHIIRHTPALYHSEQEKLEALTAVEDYAKEMLGRDFSRTISEDHPAPVEDVRLRRAPNSSTLPAVSGPAIDYRALAAAIVAVQRENAAADAEAAAPPVVHTVTDVPPVQAS